MHLVKPVFEVKDGPKCIFTLREDHILYDREGKGVVADLGVQVALINYQPPFSPKLGDHKGPCTPHRTRLLQEASGNKLVNEFAESRVSYAARAVWHTFLRLWGGGFKGYGMFPVRPEIPRDLLDGCVLKKIFFEGLL